RRDARSVDLELAPVRGKLGSGLAPFDLMVRKHILDMLASLWVGRHDHPTRSLVIKVEEHVDHVRNVGQGDLEARGFDLKRLHQSPRWPWGGTAAGPRG